MQKANKLQCEKNYHPKYMSDICLGYNKKESCYNGNVSFFRREIHCDEKTFFVVKWYFLFNDSCSLLLQPV